MTSSDDPFLNPPRTQPAPTGDASGAAPSVPPPPPIGTGPVSMPPPPPAQVGAAAYPPPYAAGMYPPGAAEPRWKRAWGVTMARWGLATGVLVVLSFAATFVFAARGADSYDLAYVFGYIFAPVILYILLFGWWLDHIVARTGMWGSFAIHGGAGFVLAALATFSQMTAQSEGRAAPELELAGVPPTMPMFIWIVGWPLSHLVASMLKKSFPPKASASAAATLA